MLSSKNSSCRVFNAFFTSSLTITAEILRSDAPCAMALILTLFFPKVLNILPLNPWWLFMLSPTRAIIAKSRSAITGFILPKEISYSKASFTICTALSESLSAIPTHIECSDDACVINTTLILDCDNTSKKRLDIPGIPTIPDPSKESNAMFST